MSIQKRRLSAGVWNLFYGGTPDGPIIPQPPDGSRAGLDNMWGTYQPTLGSGGNANVGLWNGYSVNYTSGVTNLPNYHAGDWIITEAVAAGFPNRTISGYKIDGRVQVRAPNVTLENCWVRGTVNPNTGLVKGDDMFLVDTSDLAATSFEARDCLIVPQTPRWGWNAFGPRNYSAIRCYTQWTVDSFRVYPYFTSTAGSPFLRPQSTPVNVRILGCMAGFLSYFSPDPNHTNDNRTHNDVIQWEGGSGLQVIGNAFYGRMAGSGSGGALWPGANYSTSGTDAGSVSWNIFAPGNPQPPSVPGGYGRFGFTPSTSILQVTQNVGQCTGLVYDRNWQYGGATQFNASNGGSYPPPATKTTNLGSITNNWSDLEVGQPGNNVAVGVNFTFTASGNKRSDGSAAGVKTQTT